MRIYFFTRSLKKGSEEVSIWLRYRTSKSDLRASTGERIPEKFWDRKRGYIRRGITVSRSEEQFLDELGSRLDGLERTITELASLRSDDFTLEELNRITRTYRNAAVSEDNPGNDEPPTRRIPLDMAGYAEWLVNEMQTGRFLYKGRRYDTDTVKNWRNFIFVLKNFLQWEFTRSGRIPTFSGFNRRTADSFMTFLKESGYMTKSANNYIKTLKAMLKYSLADGVHSNVRAEQFLYKQRELEGNTATKIFLTRTELQALYEMPLTGMKEVVRDVFLVGCYTCQRISDYRHLTAENFSTTPRGTNVVRLTQEKTDNSIVIPVLNGNLLLIARKYDYNLPEVCEQVLNKYIKKIARELSETVPSLAEPVRTALTLPETRAEDRRRAAGQKTKYMYTRSGVPMKPKYDMITSHTARRSGITNLYLSGLFTVHQMMSVSGHTSEQNFYQYVRLSGDDIADQIDGILRKKAAAGRKSNEDLF